MFLPLSTYAVGFSCTKAKNSYKRGLFIWDYQIFLKGTSLGHSYILKPAYTLYELVFIVGLLCFKKFTYIFKCPLSLARTSLCIGVVCAVLQLFFCHNSKLYVLAGQGTLRGGLPCQFQLHLGHIDEPNTLIRASIKWINAVCASSSLPTRWLKFNLPFTYTPLGPAACWHQLTGQRIRPENYN